MNRLNEKLTTLVRLIKLAIEYYNDKYNYFIDSNDLNIISFIRKQDYIEEFNFDLLKNALYKNLEYQNFIKTYNIQNLNELFIFYDELINEIKTNMNIPRNIKVNNIDNYLRKNLNINYEIKFSKENKNIELYDIKSLIYTYVTFYFEKDINYTIKKVINIIQTELEDIKNGHCNILENIIFTPQTMYGQTDDYAKNYLYIFTDLDNTDSIKYNYKLHKVAINILKESDNVL